MGLGMSRETVCCGPSDTADWISVWCERLLYLEGSYSRGLERRSPTRL